LVGFLNGDLAGGSAPLSMISVHAWSAFRDIWDGDPSSQNGDYEAVGHEAGIGPASWVADRLDGRYQVATPPQFLRILLARGRGEANPDSAKPHEEQ
jgi:hypothetical protein